MKERKSLLTPLRVRVSILLNAVLTFCLLSSAWGKIVLKVDDLQVCRGDTNTTLTISLDNDTDIAGIQFDFRYDPDCFTIEPQNLTRTDRTTDFRIFEASSSEPGHIKFIAVEIGRYIAPGTGPIAEFLLYVSNTCEIAEYTFALSHIKLANMTTWPISYHGENGTISVMYCDSLLGLSSTEFDFGNVWVGHVGIDTLIITNIGSLNAEVYLETESCAGADPTAFLLDAGRSEKVTVTCSPEEPGLCEGKIFVYGSGNYEINVTCNGVTPDSAVMRVDDRVVFQNTKNNRITLSAENQVKVDGLQTDISFDTSCFDVTKMNKTGRTMGMNIFQYAKTDTGVKLAMTSICAGIVKGTGSIVEFEVDIGDCPEGNYPWTLSNTRMADSGGTELVVEEIDGAITVLTGTYGDVNNDGHIDVRDVVLGVRILLGHLTDPTLGELAATDCNSDGEIDVSDILGIVNTILGTGNCPP